MAELDPFGAPSGAPGGPAMGNGVAGAGEEDPAAAFLAQQESEIAGIENDEAFAILDGGAPGPQPHGEPPGGPDAVDGVMNGEYYQESNGPTDSYAAISQVDRLQSEPESIRKWREEQMERLEALDANSRKQEAEWKEKAIKELEEWYARQDEQLQKTKANNSTNINHPCYSLEHLKNKSRGYCAVTFVLLKNLYKFTWNSVQPTMNYCSSSGLACCFASC
ncbi:clathrin light chain A isoform X2 [Camelus ferus]|uniref:Clathrin light chain n=2 Tax=Camelus TaxID=9836 RepID=A0A8B8SV83_CAMFR|nr:clathrin light chain A isoform X2 [Camelus ferus]XP_045371150.1 clathrin light chain A isoform X5 [Camelus bactrianus]